MAALLDFTRLLDIDAIMEAGRADRPSLRDMLVRGGCLAAAQR